MKYKENASIEIIRYNVGSSAHGDFEKAYLEAGKILQSSVYCTAYTIIKGSDEPNNYIVTIHWTSKEDHLHKFRNSSIFQNFFQFVKPYFNSIEEMKHYQLPLATWIKDNDE